MDNLDEVMEFLKDEFEVGDRFLVHSGHGAYVTLELNELVILNKTNTCIQLERINSKTIIDDVRCIFWMKISDFEVHYKGSIVEKLPKDVHDQEKESKDE